jgi:hypothetical protein
MTGFKDEDGTRLLIQEDRPELFRVRKDGDPMKRIYLWLGAVIVPVACQQVALAQYPHQRCLAPFGGPGLCAGLFPHLHQHGPLYNYGPYYGYPPFEPYGPWTAQLQYNPPLQGTGHLGRLTEDKSGHGGLLTQWGLSSGEGIGGRLVRWSSSPASSGGIVDGLWRGRFNSGGTCSNCSVAPSPPPGSAKP